MTTRRAPQLSSRKQPQQARSADLVAVILQTAIQVLAEQGRQRFTTARVADRAGVSVGSVYQYFPNKAAILFRLQSDEWARTASSVCAILLDSGQSTHRRLRAWVHAFIQSECEEAQVRIALNDAAPGYRDAPEARTSRVSIDRAMQAFMAEALPDAPPQAREATGDMIRSTLNAAGKQFSMAARTPLEIHAYAETLADMFCAYLAAVTSGDARPARDSWERR